MWRAYFGLSLTSETHFYQVLKVIQLHGANSLSKFRVPVSSLVNGDNNAFLIDLLWRFNYIMYVIQL